MINALRTRWKGYFHRKGSTFHFHIFLITLSQVPLLGGISLRRGRPFIRLSFPFNFPLLSSTSLETGLTIKQGIGWNKNSTLANCFLYGTTLVHFGKNFNLHILLKRLLICYLRNLLSLHVNNLISVMYVILARYFLIHIYIHSRVSQVNYFIPSGYI